MAWRRVCVMTTVLTACGDDVAGTATAGSSSTGSSSDPDTGTAPPSPTTTADTGTLSDAMTGTSGPALTTDATTTSATTTDASSTSTTEPNTSTSSTDPGSSSSTDDTSTGEPLACGDPDDSPGAAVAFGGLGGEQALGFAVGEDGARYSGGVFFGPSVDLAPGGGAVFPAQGDSGNMWLNKVDAAGDYVYGFTWPTLDGYHCYVWGFAPAPDGSVHVVGHFVGDLDLDPGPGVDKHVAGNGAGDLAAFLISLGPDGAYQWGRSWGSDWTTAFSIVRADDGALYVTGYFGGDLDLDPGPGVDMATATGVGNATDGYLSKFDLGGNYQWGRTWGAGGEVYSYDVALDEAAAAVVVSGTTGGPADLDPGPGMQVHLGLGLADTFVTRFQSDGTWDWAFAIGGDGYEQINDLTVDPQGRIWVAGGTASPSIDLDPGPGVAVQLAMGQGYDGFVARYAPDAAYEAHLPIGGPAHDNLWGITADCHGNLYVAGHFSGSVDLDPGPGQAMHVSGGESDPFLLALDDAGAHRWSRSWPNLESGVAQAVAVGPGQSVHAQINFNGLIDADAGDGSLPVPAGGDQDVLLQRVRPGTGDW